MVYYLLLAGLTGVGLWLGRENPGQAVPWKRAAYCAAAFCALTLTAGLRYGIGFDYHHYLPLFERIGASPWGSLLLDGPAEPGFCLLTKLIMIPSQSAVWIYFAYAGILYGILSAVIYRHSQIPWMSYFVFVALAFFASSINLLRQTLAAVIFLPAIPFLQRKQPAPYFLLVLAAASIHKTALLLLPVYFIANLPLNRIAGSVYAAGGALVFLFSEPLMRLAVKFLFPGYAGQERYTGGSQFAYVMIPMILLALGIALKNRLLRADPRNLVYVNFCVYGLFFEAMMVRHFILERFALYFTLPLILMLPALARTFEPREEDAASRADGRFRSEKARMLLAKKELRERRQIYYSLATALCAVCFVHFVMSVNFRFHNASPYYSIFSEEAANGEEIPYVPYGRRDNG